METSVVSSHPLLSVSSHEGTAHGGGLRIPVRVFDIQLDDNQLALRLTQRLAPVIQSIVKQALEEERQAILERVRLMRPEVAAAVEEAMAAGVVLDRMPANDSPGR